MTRITLALVAFGASLIGWVSRHRIACLCGYHQDMLTLDTHHVRVRCTECGRVSKGWDLTWPAQKVTR